MTKNYDAETAKATNLLAVSAKTDPKSFEKLYHDFQPLLISASNGIGSGRIAEKTKVSPFEDYNAKGDSDLFQEASIAFWKCVNTYNPDKNVDFSAFAHMVVKRKMIDMYRKSLKDRILDSLNDVDECGVEKMNSIEAPSKCDPAYAYDYKESYIIIKNALKKEIQRRVMNLFSEGFTATEIAKIIGVSDSSISRAKKSIIKTAKELAERSDEVGPTRVRLAMSYNSQLMVA